MDQAEWKSALHRGDLETVRTLAMADPELLARPVDGVSPLLQALYHGGSEVAAWLRDYAVALTVHEAAAVGDTAALEKLLASDSDAVRAVAADGFTPVHLAAFFGHPKAVTLLIGAGADVDAVADNPSRVRPLHSAVASRNAAAVHAVLDGSPEVDARQAGGFTALHAAALHGDEAMVDMLLGAHADVAIQADDGRSAADFARAGGFEALADRLGQGR